MKSKIIILSVFALSCSLAQAAETLKPGLWEVESKSKVNGKDPAADAQKSMANLPAAQRKQMEEMMKKNGMSMDKQSVKVCFTEASFKDPTKLVPQQNTANSECTSKEVTKTADKVVVEFTCKNGSKGKSEWESHSNSFSSKSTFTDANGKKAEASSSAKFISADCGSIKPMSAM